MSHEDTVALRQAPFGAWTEDDRKFFERNKAKTYRLRSAFESEIHSFETEGMGDLIEVLRSNALPRDEVVILVVQMKPGYRGRIPCLPRRHGRLLTAAKPFSSSVEMKEYEPEELSRVIRSLAPDDPPPPREDLDNCALCLHEFEHGEVSPHVMLPGRSLHAVICGKCIEHLPIGSKITSLGMFFKYDPKPGSPEFEKFERLARLMAEQWRLYKQ